MVSELGKDARNRLSRGFTRGLGAFDALHITAAHLLDTDELVTSERPGKAIYRTASVRVVYLYAGLHS